MPSGLAALLDDVALIAKAASASVDDVAAAAARTSAKAAGVVIDDTAVTPRFVAGVTPARELPIIFRIAKGSVVNKIAIILPICLLLNALAPWALTPLLMLGGLYLSFEGAENTWVRGAITTDLILSAEIMVISLNEVATKSFWMQLVVLIVVAFVVTAMVYGAVAVLVKMDDVGLKLSAGDNAFRKRLGHGLVTAMPKVLHTISIIGMFAMLWVGGHILLVGANELGWHAPYELVHGWAHHVAHLGGFVEWLVETLCSLVIGLAVGAIVVVVLHFIPRRKAKAPEGVHDAEGRPATSDE